MKGIILAGGSGTRLWPLSRSNFPKQFLKLLGNESFLQQTVRRNLEFMTSENLFIVSHSDFYHMVAEQTREIDPILENNIILEPAQKNTAPAIALAMRALIENQAIDEDEVFFVAPSDHLITPQKKYLEYLERGEALAKEGKIVTFGIRPTSPETGYGYIEAEKDCVKRFVEKPDLKTAQNYLLDGNFFWNSGMFAFTFKTMAEEFKKHAPEIARILNTPLQKMLHEFEEIPNLSIDYAIMERSDRVAMIPLEITWSDIGSWENLYSHLEKDQNHNAISGNVTAIETTNSLIFSENRLVTTIGVDNVLVVATDDVVLVADKSASQKVKEVVGKLSHLGKKEIHEHLTTHRPWGSYTILEEGERYKIKKIQVKPLHKLSLQMHYHRSEHWVVVSGTAEVTIGEDKKIVHEGESIFVPKSAMHRVENPGKVSLEIIEVQVGEYLGEDDIVRFEDVYGRLKEREAFQILLKNRP